MTASGEFVLDVVGLRADPKMGRVAAGRVIAVMKHEQTIRDRAYQ
jgi:hypothetical protein